MWGFWETIARDGWTYDLKHNLALVLCEKRHNSVKLKEGAGPAMNKHEGQNPLILAFWWPHMDEVHIQSYMKVKKNVR